MDRARRQRNCSYANDHGASRAALRCAATCEATARSSPAVLCACRATCVNVYLQNVVSAQQATNECLQIAAAAPAPLVVAPLSALCGSADRVPGLP